MNLPYTYISVLLCLGGVTTVTTYTAPHASTLRLVKYVDSEVPIAQSEMQRRQLVEKMDPLKTPTPDAVRLQEIVIADKHRLSGHRELVVFPKRHDRRKTLHGTTGRDGRPSEGPRRVKRRIHEKRSKQEKIGHRHGTTEYSNKDVEHLMFEETGLSNKYPKRKTSIGPHGKAGTSSRGTGESADHEIPMLKDSLHGSEILFKRSATQKCGYTICDVKSQYCDAVINACYSCEPLCKKIMDVAMEKFCNAYCAGK